MKPTIKMIAALRKAAKMVLDPECGYEWQNTMSCNCGILLQALGDNPKKYVMNDRITDRIYDLPPNRKHGKRYIGWSALEGGLLDLKNHCSVTGLPVPELFKKLERHGFELDKYDLELIETAGKGYDHIAQTSGSIACSYANPTSVSKFFNELADKLEKEREEIKNKAKAVVVSKVFESEEEEEVKHQHVTNK